MKKLWKKRLAYFVQIDLFVSMLSIILKLWLMFWKYFLNKRDHLYKIGQFSVFFFFCEFSALQYSAPNSINDFKWCKKSHWSKGMGQREVQPIAYMPLLDDQDKFKSTTNKLFLSNYSTYLPLYDRKGAPSGLRQFFVTENLKMMKNAFCLTLKALFVLKILKFLS